jgi:two-component system nitrogen regulation sensor histidine kinase NtrY
MPYFTLMPKGTGLGLAIVKKIVQDHGGELSFGESVLGGAKVTITLPFSVEGINE